MFNENDLNELYLSQWTAIAVTFCEKIWTNERCFWWPTLISQNNIPIYDVMKNDAKQNSVILSIWKRSD